MPATENVITLQPATLARYERQLSAPRDLIDTVTVSRDRSKPGGLEVEIAGRLNALIDAPAYPLGVRGSGGKVVAGERYRLSAHSPIVRYTLRSYA